MQGLILVPFGILRPGFPPIFMAKMAICIKHVLFKVVNDKVLSYCAFLTIVRI